MIQIFCIRETVNSEQLILSVSRLTAVNCFQSRYKRLNFWYVWAYILMFPAKPGSDSSKLTLLLLLPANCWSVAILTRSCESAAPVCLIAAGSTLSRTLCSGSWIFALFHFLSDLKCVFSMTASVSPTSIFVSISLSRLGEDCLSWGGWTYGDDSLVTCAPANLPRPSTRTYRCLSLLATAGKGRLRRGWSRNRRETFGDDFCSFTITRWGKCPIFCFEHLCFFTSYTNKSFNLSNLSKRTNKCHIVSKMTSTL
jgi:hypothetical protein